MSPPRTLTVHVVPKGRPGEDQRRRKGQRRAGPGHRHGRLRATDGRAGRHAPAQPLARRQLAQSSGPHGRAVAVGVGVEEEKGRAQEGEDGRDRLGDGVQCQLGDAQHARHHRGFADVCLQRPVVR